MALLVAVIQVARRLLRPSTPSPTPTPDWPPLEPSAEVATPPSTAPDPTEPAPSADSRWVDPEDGECPPTHPVKAKNSSKIFHVSGGGSYNRTNPDRCYLDATAAEADGYRRSKV